MLAREALVKSLLDLSDRSGAVSRSELLDELLRTALALTESDGAAVLIAHHRACERLTLRRGASDPERRVVPRAVSELTRILLRSGHPMALRDFACDAMAGDEDRCPGVEAGPALYVPLRHREHAFGYFAVLRARGRPRFSADEVRLLSFVAAWAAMALQNLRLSESLRKLAVTDDLTQVYNFRFLKTALRREMRRAGRDGQQLSLVMIDVDNLKGYNDRNGHMRGSLLLRELAGLFAQNVRTFDVVAKYGGDEFTLILPQTGSAGARVVAERMREVVAEHTFPLADTGSITVSLGVATYPDDAGDPVGLIQAADRALYVAKQRGRNRVEVLREAA